MIEVILKLNKTLSQYNMIDTIMLRNVTLKSKLIQGIDLMHVHN